MVVFMRMRCVVSLLLGDLVIRRPSGWVALRIRGLASTHPRRGDDA